jgi:hypothetical protein
VAQPFYSFYFVAFRVQNILRESTPEPAMMQALPPGAWWDRSINVWDCNSPPCRDDSSAVEAARLGALELRNVFFSYPLRKTKPGEARGFYYRRHIHPSCTCRLMLILTIISMG